MINLLLNEEASTLSDDLQSLLKSCIEASLQAEDFPFDAAVSLSITDNEGIRALNRDNRQIDRETDVLSFPMLNAEDGVLIVEDTDITDGFVFLGDIVISLPKAKEQALSYGHSLERELGFLTVHSMLHLLGYDHEEGPREESEMFCKQDKILDSIQLYR
ncbi:MAG: rRNA maturation RNase YbeY [Ruminococcaceae bacterium]|nr:rRNA maturation RNase YbeY [Oscillospiraceae bacterium]